MPMLLAFNLPPSATFFNQAISLIGWAGWAFLLFADLGASSKLRATGAAFAAALVLLGAATLSSVLAAGLPSALGISNLAIIAIAAIAFVAGTVDQSSALRRVTFRAFCTGMVVAGLASTCFGLLQVYAPAFGGGDWIARASSDGRAVGNLRQANHLCSLLLWSIVSAFWLVDGRSLRVATGVVLTAGMLFAVVLTGSRSGVFGVLTLALWGLLDLRLSRAMRIALLLAPLAYALLWFGAFAWAEYSQGTFALSRRFSTEGDISSSRFGIWANTLTLIHSNLWAGVGFGEFNFAWTLTEIPNRPVAFFDHTHNLPLQFAVELGLPLAIVLLTLLGWALWRAWRNCMLPPNPEEGASPQRAAFVMVLLVLMHSLLEYPLWYAYFLLPTAFLLGLCVAGPSRHLATAATAPRRQIQATSFRIAALVLMLGAAYSVYDYFKVVVIFAPPENAAPLAERIARGQRSLFFSHHADYAAATTSDDPVFALAAAQRAAHYLLDTRLMMAWANALHATGDSERAKYLAQRLREFRNPQSVSYFAPCDDPGVARADKPYQCFAPQRQFTFADFR